MTTELYSELTGNTKNRFLDPIKTSTHWINEGFSWKNGFPRKYKFTRRFTQLWSNVSLSGATIDSTSAAAFPHALRTIVAGNPQNRNSGWIIHKELGSVTVVKMVYCVSKTRPNCRNNVFYLVRLRRTQDAYFKVIMR